MAFHSSIELLIVMVQNVKIHICISVSHECCKRSETFYIDALPVWMLTEQKTNTKYGETSFSIYT